MASQIGSLSIDLEARLAKFESDMGRAARIADKEMQKMKASVSKQLQSIESQFNSFSNTAANAVKGLVAAFSVREIAQFAKKTIDIADNINDMSKKFGISTQTISVWRLTAEKSGTSLDGIARAAKFLAKDIEKSSGTLQQMGISMEDAVGKTKSIEAVMDEVAKKFSGYEDGAKKAELATKLFGKSGVDLIPFLNEFGSNLEKNKQKAKEFGTEIGPAFAKMADDINDNFRDIGGIVEGFANDILKEIGPLIKDITDDFINWAVEMRKSGKAQDFAKDIVDGIKLLTSAMEAAIKISTAYFALFVAAPKLFTALNGAVLPLSQTFTLVGKSALSFGSVLSGVATAAFAAFAGWEIGKWLSENFLEAKLAGIAFVEGTLVGWERIKQYSAIAWEAIKAGFTGAINIMREGLSALFGRFAEAAELLPSVFGGDKVVQGLKNLQEAIKPTTDASDELSKSIQQINADAEKNIAGIKVITSEMADYAIENFNGAKAAEEAAKKTDEQANASMNAVPKIQDLEKATRDLANASEQAANLEGQLADMIDRQDSSIGPITKAYNNYEIAKRKAAEIGEKLLKIVKDFPALGIKEAQVHRKVADAIDAASDARDREIESAKEQADVIGRIIKDIQEDAQFEGLDERSKYIAQAVEKLKEEYAALNDELKALQPPLEKQIQQLEEVAGHYYDVGEAARRASDSQEAFKRSWEGAIQSINAAFADFLTGGLKDFKSFGDSLSRIAQDFFSNIIQQTLKAGDGFKGFASRINQASMFGPGGTGFTMQGGLGALGSAYGAYQSYRQGDTMGTIANAAMAGSQIGGITGGIIGAIVGAVASAFRSNKPPDIRIGGANSRVRNAEENFSTVLGDFQLGTRQIERTPLIEGLKDFDKMIKQMLDAAGVGSEQMARIRSALQSVVLDLKGDSATAENVLKARFDAILGTFDAATQEYVRAGADLQEQVQRLGEKLEFPKQLQALLDQLAEEDQLAVMSELERQIFQINKQFDAMVEQATFLGATQEQLAQIEQYRANTLARLNDVQQGASVDEYARAVAELNNEFIQLTTGLRPGKLSNALFEIRKEESGRIQTLNRLARESGRAGAAEEDLATVHKIAAAKAAQAIAQMRSAAESLVQQLYGGGGIGGSSPAQEAASSLDATAEDLFAGWESALESIRGFLDSILLDEGLTVLTPQQQLMEAQRQFRSLLSSAQGGDAEAASKLPELARQLLDNARAFFASGSGYDQIFADVMAGLQSVQGIAPGPGTTAGAEQAITQAELAANDVEQQRMLMAIELAGYIKELSDAMGENVFALTEELGINLTAFVNDLGVDISNMTATTASQLADIANMLGVELPELAYQLGISLGSLRETNSLLNDALESAINEQPPEIADELRPYLAAVENAVTDADANAAIDSLNSAVSRIGGATAVALAPYLENVDPPSMGEELGYLDAIWGLNRDYLPQIETWLEQIAASVRRDTPPPTSGSFATGTSYVPYDMTAEIHRGEKIIDAKTSTLLDQYGISVRPVRSEKSSDDSSRMVRELMQRISDQDAKSARREERLTAAIERLAFSGSRGR